MDTDRKAKGKRRTALQGGSLKNAMTTKVTMAYDLNRNDVLFSNHIQFFSVQHKIRRS